MLGEKCLNIVRISGSILRSPVSSKGRDKRRHSQSFFELHGEDHTDSFTPGYPPRNQDNQIALSTDLKDWKINSQFPALDMMWWYLFPETVSASNGLKTHVWSMCWYAQICQAELGPKFFGSRLTVGRILLAPSWHRLTHEVAQPAPCGAVSESIGADRGVHQLQQFDGWQKDFGNGRGKRGVCGQCNRWQRHWWKHHWRIWRGCRHQWKRHWWTWGSETREWSEVKVIPNWSEAGMLSRCCLSHVETNLFRRLPHHVYA